MQTITDSIKANLKANGGKISFDFIENLAEYSEKVYLHPTPRTRICILITYSGHEVVGFARVLDPKNDDEEIGNRVAFENARDELWAVCGAIALAI